MHSRELLGVSAAVLAALVMPVAAVAQSASAKATVDAAKAAGVVGEQADGFLGFVTGNADAATRAAVAEINAGRAQVYRRAAAENNVSEAAAGASAFKTLLDTGRIRPGEYYKPAGGNWTRR